MVRTTTAIHRACTRCSYRWQRAACSSASIWVSAPPGARSGAAAPLHRSVHSASSVASSTSQDGPTQEKASSSLPSPTSSLRSSSTASPSTSALPSSSSVTLTCSSVSDTHRVAALVSSVVTAGDVVLLWGEVGAGKSEFARGFLRTWMAQPQLTVRSPTYTLLVEYPRGDLTAYHLDLYRLQEERELAVLPLQSMFEQGVSLIEWPERLQSMTPQHALSVRLSRREEELGRWAGEEDTAGRRVELDSSAAKWKAAIEQWKRNSARLGIDVSG